MKTPGNTPLEHVNNSKYFRTLTQHLTSRKQRRIHNRFRKAKMSIHCQTIYPQAVLMIPCYVKQITIWRPEWRQLLVRTAKYSTTICMRSCIYVNRTNNESTAIWWSLQERGKSTSPSSVLCSCKRKYCHICNDHNQDTTYCFLCNIGWRYRTVGQAKHAFTE